MTDSERIAVKSATRAGRIWGYGNIIERLQMAWLKMLIEDGIDIRTAAKSVGIGDDEERVAKLERMDRASLMSSIDQFTGEQP